MQALCFTLWPLPWDKLTIRGKKLKASLMFKALKGNTPSYLSDLFSIRGTGFNLLNSEIKIEFVQDSDELPKEKLLLQWGTIVKSLPPEIRKLQTLSKFKKAVNKYYDSLSQLPHGNLVNQ